MEETASPVSRAAAIAPLYGNAILLGKRLELHQGKPVPYGGYWSIFGGRLNEGENPMCGAVRELEEETEIKVSIKDLRFVTRLVNTDSEFIFYFTELPSLINPVLNFEHTEYGWFRIDSLDTFPEKIDPKILKCIKDIEQLRY